jgi:hypothetical protein
VTAARPPQHLIVAEPNRHGTSIFLVEQNKQMALQVRIIFI